MFLSKLLMCRFIQIKSVRLKIKTKNDSTKLPESQWKIFSTLFLRMTLLQWFSRICYIQRKLPLTFPLLDKILVSFKLENTISLAWELILTPFAACMYIFFVSASKRKSLDLSDDETSGVCTEFSKFNPPGTKNFTKKCC